MKVVIVFPHVGYCTGWRPHLATEVKNGATYHIAQALTYLYSIARRFTDEVLVIDFNFDSHEENLRKLERFGPDAVLISSTVNSYDSTRQIARDVAGLGVKVFIGGPAVSSNYYLRPDLLDVGAPCEFVVTNKDIFAWTEQVFGEDRHFRFNEFAVDNSWIAETYPEHVRSALRYTVASSIGCTFKCHFCLNPMVYKINYKEPALLESEIGYLMENYGADAVSVADPYFFMRQSHADDVMSVMEMLGIRWSQQTCLVTLTPENLSRMAETGCRSVLVGIENFASGEIDKPVEVDNFEHVVAEAKGLGISVKPSFISALLDIDYDADVQQVHYIKSLIDRDLVPGHNIQSNIYSPYIPDSRDRLLDVPFRFWGVMPVTAQDKEHWTRNMALCDLIYDLVFPDTKERYAEVRAEYLDHLATLDDWWVKHRPVPEMSLDKRPFLLTSGKVRAEGVEPLPGQSVLKVLA